jgi:hypothetical protein
MLDSPRERSRKLVGITRYFSAHYKRLEQEGAAPYRLTALGAWAASRAPHVYYFFKCLGLEKYRLFLDLGSGDGVVACVAGLFTMSIGVEVEAELCRTAHEAAQRLGLGGRVHYLCADFRTQPICMADCLYIYPDKPIYDLEGLLVNWTGDLLVYGSHMPPKKMIPEHKLRCGREQLILYRNESNRPPRHTQSERQEIIHHDPAKDSQ